MNSVMTQWAFGFGGWIGVFGGFFMFLNIPHNYTALLLLLSPWLGGISLYLLMFATFSWMNVCTQVTSAMLKQEIVVAVLTSFVGVLIVAIARMIIEMDRGHRTPAQAAAEESSASAVALPPSPPSEPETETVPADADSQQSDNDCESPSCESPDESGEESLEETDENESNEDGDEEGSEDEDDDSDENEDSESSLNKARTDSSYENIQTPQLSGMKSPVSPIPPIPDV